MSNLYLPSPSTLVTPNLFSLSENLFLFCKVHLYLFLDIEQCKYYPILSWFISSQFIHVAANGILLFLWLIFHCRWYSTSLSIHLSVDIQVASMSWLLSIGCCEHWGACIFLNYDFLQIYAQKWDFWIT